MCKRIQESQMMMDEGSQDSLFGSASAGEQRALGVGEAESSWADMELPALVQHWVESWPVYVAAIETAEAAVRCLRGQERALGHNDSSAWQWDPMGRTSVDGLARSAMDAVTGYARETLCGGDATVFSEYAAGQIVAACGCLDDRESPDFSRYWAALVERFGRGKGQEMRLVQAAKRLREQLNIYDEYDKDRSRFRAEPKMERGGVTFELRSRWTERCWSGGAYELTYRCCEEVSAIVGDLEAILGSVVCANAHRNHFWQARSHKISLPYRADVAGFRWALFKDNSKLWMSQGTAIALRARLDDLAPCGACS